MENMSQELSILEYIQKYTGDDGRLHAPRSIGEAYGTAQKGTSLTFADGMLDGMTMYDGPAPVDVHGLCRAVEKASDGDFENAFLEAFQFFQKEDADMLSSIDDLTDWVRDHTDTLHAGHLLHFSLMALLGSKDINITKLGLSLLELIDTSTVKEARKAIMTLALSDEFTLFCTFAAETWPDKNEAIFSMARHVSGWGRIFAVNRLEPATEEIRDWLLAHGCDNDVLAQYTACKVAGDVDLVSLLERPHLSHEDYKKAGRIVEALTEDGPADGLSEFPKKEELLKAYFQQTERQVPDIEDLTNVYRLLCYVHQNMDGDKEQYRLKQLGGALICSRHCKDTVMAAMKKGEGYTLASAMGLDCREAARQCIETDPLRHIDLLPYVLGKDRYANQAVIALYEKALPLGEIAFAISDDDGASELFERKYIELSQVLQCLGNYPALGEKLIRAALRSPSRQNQNMARRVIEAWREKGYVPPRDIHDLLHAAAE